MPSWFITKGAILLIHKMLGRNWRANEWSEKFTFYNIGISNFSLPLHCCEFYDPGRGIQLSKHWGPLRHTTKDLCIEGFVARRHGVLEISSGIEDLGGLKWQLVLPHVIGWVVIYCCIIRGVKSVGKVNHWIYHWANENSNTSEDKSSVALNLAQLFKRILAH